MRARVASARAVANRQGLVASLQQAGLSPLGAEQALEGGLVTDARDRAAVARILTSFAAIPRTVAVIYDYPGVYAQRFDGIDRGGEEE